MSAVLYELALMGLPSDDQVREVEQHLLKGIEPFGLTLGKEVAWSTRVTSFEPSQRIAAGVVFLGPKASRIQGLSLSCAMGFRLCRSPQPMAGFMRKSRRCCGH